MPINQASSPTGSWLSHPRRRDYRLITFVLLLVLLALRLYLPVDVVGVRFDEAKYLGVAKNFPLHRLYNDDLFLIHGPGYPALIRLGTLVVPDHVAAICASIVMSAVAFWAVGLVGRALRLGRTGTLLARTFLVFQPLYMALGQAISKESAMVGLYAVLLGGFMSTIGGSRRGRWLAAAAGGCFALTADQHVPHLLISLAVVRFAWPHRTKRMGLVTLTPMLVIWIAAVIVRMVWFDSGPLVPMGIDGMPERSEDLSLVQAIIPNTSRQSKALSEFHDFETNVANSGSFVRNFFRLSPQPYGVHIWHGVLLALIPLGAVRAAFLEKRRRRWLGFGMILATGVLFAVPMLIKPHTRYAVMAVVPMAALVAMNARWFGGRLVRGRPAWWAIAACVVFLGAATFVSPGSRHSVLHCRTAVEAEVVAKWFNKRPTRGIMTQTGYTPELAYLTDRRVVGLPDDPTVLFDAIRYFEVSHIVFGSYYSRRWDWPQRSKVWNFATIDIILANPGLFRAVANLKQPAGQGRAADEYLILEVDASLRRGR